MSLCFSAFHAGLHTNRSTIFREKKWFPQIHFYFPFQTKLKIVTATNNLHMFFPKEKLLSVQTSIKPFFIANPHSNSFHTSPKRFRPPPATEWLGLFSLPSTPNNSPCVWVCVWNGKMFCCCCGCVKGYSHIPLFFPSCLYAVCVGRGCGRVLCYLKTKIWIFFRMQWKRKSMRLQWVFVGWFKFKFSPVTWSLCFVFHCASLRWWLSNNTFIRHFLEAILYVYQPSDCRVKSENQNNVLESSLVLDCVRWTFNLGGEFMWTIL